ncbi:MAG: hypothetical protein MI924_04850 [Chloroflexales bacterium]|nr:hypothetical protein [Chloroflexales bacterium]
MRRASAAPEAHHWIAFTRSAFRAMRRNCGVLPDYDVRPELSNFAAGRDMVLEFTKALIQEEGARL